MLQRAIREHARTVILAQAGPHFVFEAPSEKDSIERREWTVPSGR
jgi:hypothetical protein